MSFALADALAWHLGLPGTSRDWANPLEGTVPATLAALLRAEHVRLRLHLLPWLWRHARGHSSGDGIHAKRPELAPFIV